ncbi:MAG: shikimate dehydrogenase [Vicinamibacterales bacterium]
MTPLLCVTAAAATMPELCRARDDAFATGGADLVEMRLDHTDHPDVAAALAGRTGPVILTCRAPWEGGRFAGSEEERRRILEHAVQAGAEYVDVEAAAAFAPALIASCGGRGIVVSRHQFDAPPRDLASSYRDLRSRGAQVAKLAVAVDRLRDMLPLFELGRDDEPHVLLAMGAAGVASRVLAARLRNQWTFAGDAVAPGQLPAERMLRHLHFRRIRPDAALYGVTGNPVMHSRSPIMHNAGFAALGRNAAYLPLEAADAEDLATFVRALDFQGISITAPFKVTLMPFVDELSDVARRVGAINTIVVRNSRWIGDNTDVEGFLAPLADVPLRHTRVCILGSGGAARAVAVGLADRGAEVVVSARRGDAARELAELASGRVVPFPPPADTWDLLVNAIPAGPAVATESPIGQAPLDGRVVYDLVYEPEHTKLLVDARAAGCRTIGGLDMLIAQAERQFELWTGQRPPVGLFSSAARSAADRQPRPDAVQVL